MLWRRVGHYAEQAGLQVPLEDASVGWLEPLGHLFWEVLEGKDLILFASLSQNPMKEMTGSYESLVTVLHQIDENDWILETIMKDETVGTD